MLGSSGHHTENRTTNPSGTTCWERCHVPRTFKNASVVSSWSRNLWVRHRRQIARPYSPLPISSGNQNSCISSHILFHNHSIFIFNAFYVDHLNIAEILLIGRETPTVNHLPLIFYPRAGPGDKRIGLQQR